MKTTDSIQTLRVRIPAPVFVGVRMRVGGTVLV
jgi:hypothetical protein